MNEFETERRLFGVWSVAYQPDLPGEIVNAYREMFDFLRLIVINEGRFNLMRMRQLACIQATYAFADPTNKLVSDFGFMVDRGVVLKFSQKVDSRLTGTPQSGQNVLRIIPKSDPGNFAIIDPACYLYDIAYENMPVAVGDKGFVQEAMAEIYSSLTGNPVRVKLISMNKTG